MIMMNERLAGLFLAAMVLFCFTGCVIKEERVKSQAVNFNRFPVLEYHLIGRPEGRWKRTPENFRKDLEWLYQNGYYPFNLRDILSGFRGLPEGKKPVILTFDDSSSGQFRYLPGGKIDPDCAVGIIRAFHEKYPNDWPLRATFFVLIETSAPDRNLFGQPQHAIRKLRRLTEWGMEVGSHTYSHDRFDWLDASGIRKTLGRSNKKLKELSGQEIVSLAIPLGIYPKNTSVLSGEYQGVKYQFKLIADVAGGLNSKKFDPLHIRRIQAIDPEWKKFFGRQD